MLSASEPAGFVRADDRFRQLVESIDDFALYMLDVGGRLVTWNLGAEVNMGYVSPEVVGKHFKIFFVPEDLASDLPARNLEEARESGRCSGEGWRLRKSGERFWASFTITCIRDSNGKLVGFAKVTRDFTERRRQRDEMLRLERALREERDTLRAASESAVDAFFICEALRDADGEVEDFVFIDVNGKAEALMSTPRARFIGGRMSELFAELNERKNLLQQCKTVVSTGDPMNHEFPMGAEGPLSAWMRAQAVKLRDGVAITISDISERKRSEAHMIHAAHHDHLTGLPNRNLLTDRLEQAIERSRRDGSKAAVLAIDLDGFKQVNDTFGHATGDGVLITAAARLKMSVRATDTVARIGGDEFVVIMPEIREFANVLQCAEKIVRALREGVEVQGHAVRISCSVGISVYPDSATSARDLLTQSDAAMYLAKQNGKNQLALCTNEALASGLPENILWARPAIPTAACVGHRLLGAEFLQQIPSELADFPQGLPIGMLAGATRRGTDISKSAFARAKSRRPVD